MRAKPLRGKSVLRKPIEKGQWILRIICALALLFVAFGHQPMALAENASPDITAYALPDGSLPILCVSESDSGQKDKTKHIHAQDCDACRISASVLLPQPVDSLGERLQLASFAAMRSFTRIAQRRVFSPGTAPRAPPIA